MKLEKEEGDDNAFSITYSPHNNPIAFDENPTIVRDDTTRKLRNTTWHCHWLSALQEVVRKWSSQENMRNYKNMVITMQSQMKNNDYKRMPKNLV